MDFSTREHGIAQYNSAVHAMQITNRWAAFGQHARCSSSIHWQASASQESCADKIWGGRFDWGRGGPGLRAEGAGRRAGTHPRLRQQGPEPARRGEQRQEEEQASGGAGSEAIDRQTRGCRLCRVRIFGAKIFDIGKTVGPHRWRCVASLHTRCLKSAPIAAVTKNLARFVNGSSFIICTEY